MKRTVLIADAEPRIDRQLRTGLLAQGYDVLCASTLEEAQDRFDLRAIDLLLLDLDVPSAAAWSRFPGISQLNPDLRIIGLTERSDMADMALRSFLTGVAEKPIDFTLLLKSIEEMLGQTSGSKGFRYIGPKPNNFRQKVS